jgi:hypothetical protein
MTLDLAQLAYHQKLWSDLATEGGWSSTNPDLTIWLNELGDIEDSVGTRDGNGKLYIIG